MSAEALQTSGGARSIEAQRQLGAPQSGKKRWKRLACEPKKNVPRKLRRLLIESLPVSNKNEHSAFQEIG